ncbi:MAG: VOC family protein [Kordiimonadaceae bacterium]|nr:VOC family protein [Kordiimonadaceae bacterium]
MIGYTTVGTNDLAKSASFYDTVFAVLGAKRVMDFGEFIVWSIKKEDPGFSITKPFNKEAATVGNGNMIALSAPDRATVDKLYETALAAGGTCEGKPGIRGDDGSGFYAAYFRDLDGNKLNVFNVSSAD